jgi:hypothetical protein
MPKSRYTLAVEGLSSVTRSKHIKYEASRSRGGGARPRPPPPRALRPPRRVLDRMIRFYFISSLTHSHSRSRPFIHFYSSNYLFYFFTHSLTLALAPFYSFLFI